MRNNKGITMVILVVTIIVLLIIVGITVKLGQNTIKETKLENLKTNMLLIKAKTKETAEKANFYYKENQITDQVKEQLIGTEITNTSQYGEILGETEEGTIYYSLSNDNLNDIGLKDIKEDEGEFIVKYDISNASVEIYNTLGFKDENKVTKYSLTDIENIEL